MWTILKSRKPKVVEVKKAHDEGWNSCLNAVQSLLAEHQWVLEEDLGEEIFCNVCGQTLERALEGMRR